MGQKNSKQSLEYRVGADDQFQYALTEQAGQVSRLEIPDEDDDERNNYRAGGSFVERRGRKTERRWGKKKGASASGEVWRGGHS